MRSHSVNMFVLEFMELLRLLQVAGEIQQAMDHEFALSWHNRWEMLTYT